MIQKHLRRFAALFFFALSMVLATGLSPADAQTASEPTVFITGSNRGIGFEFAKQYTERGWHVIATTRRPDDATELNALAAQYPNLTVDKLDVTDFDAVDSLAEKYKDQPIDILINNAGILGGVETQVFGQLDYDVFWDVMAVNTLAPLKITEAFFHNVSVSELKKIMTVTSSQASIAGTRPGGGYFYSASKSAVNQFMHKLSKEVKSQGVIIGLIDPGAVDTNLMTPINLPFKLTAPAASVSDLLQLIDNYTLENTGAYLRYDGKEMPW